MLASASPASLRASTREPGTINRLFGNEAQQNTEDVITRGHPKPPNSRCSNAATAVVCPHLNLSPREPLRYRRKLHEVHPSPIHGHFSSVHLKNLLHDNRKLAAASTIREARAAGTWHRRMGRWVTEAEVTACWLVWKAGRIQREYPTLPKGKRFAESWRAGAQINKDSISTFSKQAVLLMHRSS